MKNLIYQYWDGNVMPGVRAGVDAMKKYANRIGTDYLFEENPKFVTNLGRYSPHYGAFKPIYTDKFHSYDNVLFADTDVFPVEGLSESIFDGFASDVGICTEPFQPVQRNKIPGPICTSSDEKWAKMMKARWNIDVPRTPEGLMKVYNSGVVLYSNKGMKKARDKFVPFLEYVNYIKTDRSLAEFYTCDQPYLHAMLQVVPMDYVELDNGWNSYVHYYYEDPEKKILKTNDSRTPSTKMVHIQLRTADHWEADKLWRVTNLPIEQWEI